jgi:hypothetical protein
MQIISVTTSERRAYVPITGWEGVKAALIAYESGRIESSRATEERLISDAHEEQGGAAAAFLTVGVALMAQTDSFIARLLEEAKTGLKEQGCWYRSYDYDALDTNFLKTSVEIVRLDATEDTYAINLRASYVGDKPEADLATYLGVKRGLKHCYVDVKTEPTGPDQFTFDFETILRRLDAALETSAISGEAVVAELMACNDGWTPRVTLPAPEGYEITIEPDLVGRRLDFISGAYCDRWSADGARLFGPLRRDYFNDDEYTKVKPTFRITLNQAGVNHYGHEGIVWQPEEQAKLIALSETIAAALR